MKKLIQKYQQQLHFFTQQKFATLDTVNYTILLAKLYNYSLRVTANDHLEEYLSKRYQKVKINGKYSEFESIYHWRSARDHFRYSLLCILYINVLEKINDQMIIDFADDRASITTGKTWSLNILVRTVRNCVTHYFAAIYLKMIFAGRLNLSANSFKNCLKKT